MITTNVFFKENDFIATALGRLPQDWDVVALEEITETSSGGTPSRARKEYYGGNIPWVKSGELKDNIIYKTDESITETGLRHSSTKLLPKGTLLVAMYGATVGKTAILGLEACTNQAVCAIAPKGDKIDLNYLQQQIILKRSELISASAGGAQPNISQGIIRRVRVPLPPLPEQRKIAKVLSTVDQSYQNTNEIIPKTELLKKGLMQQLLTKGIGHKDLEHSEEFGSVIPRKWNVARLGEVTNIRYGLGKPPEPDENGVPMIRATNIKRGTIVEAGLFRVKRSAIPKSRNPFLRVGDIIIVRSGAYTGDVGLVTERWKGAIVGYDLVLSPSKGVNSVFLVNYLLSSRVQTYISQLRVRAAQPHLNLSQVSNLLVPLPSLVEQEEIALTFSTIDHKLEIERSEKGRLEEVKQCLMELLLTGKIRIRVD